MADFSDFGIDTLDLPDFPEFTPPPVLPPGEIPEEGPEYGEWFLVLLKWAADWMVENIVRPAIEGAVWLLEWIRAELRYWTYEAIKFITELTETTEGLIVTLAAVIAASILIPQAISAIGATSVGIAIAKIVDWTKEKIGNILETIHFVDLISIHEVLLVLWPEWREIFTPFQDAISALAEQLGQGSGYIHAWLSVGHGLSMVGTSLLNIDPKIGEIRAMEKSQDFMKRLDEKFRAYAHDPGLIARDIMEEFYIPYAEEIRDTQSATVESIKDGRDYLLRLDGSLQELDGAFQAVIDATIPELREQMAENLEGIREGFENYRTWIEEDILPAFDVSISALETRADIIERANEVARAKLANPIEIFMATEFQDQQTQLDTWNYLNDKLKGLETPVIEEIRIVGESFSSGVSEALKTFIAAGIAPEVFSYEQPRIPPPLVSAADLKTDWFVGEF